jgi:hypothetical protein
MDVLPIDDACEITVGVDEDVLSMEVVMMQDERVFVFVFSGWKDLWEEHE